MAFRRAPDLLSMEMLHPVFHISLTSLGTTTRANWLPSAFPQPRLQEIYSTPSAPLPISKETMGLKGKNLGETFGLWLLQLLLAPQSWWLEEKCSLLPSPLSWPWWLVETCLLPSTDHLLLRKICCLQDSSWRNSHPPYPEARKRGHGEELSRKRVFVSVVRATLVIQQIL